MRNILLTIAYDGTDFYGYQDQSPKTLRTIESHLKKAIEETVKHPVNLQSAGRTDKGVHAMGQRANFHSETTIDLGNLPRVINQYLPKKCPRNFIPATAPRTNITNTAFTTANIETAF